MRVRKHANPFNFPRDLPKLQINELYPHPKHPLHLDIGFAQGEFLLKMAQNHPEWNFLGMEVRGPLVDRMKELIAEKGLTNIHVVSASSIVNWDILPDHSLDRVTVFFPDPWFKERHHKRRIINPSFLKQLPHKLKPDGTLLLQTDVEDFYRDTKELLTQHPEYHVILDEPGVYHFTDFVAASYYEKRCMDKGWQIYRLGFTLKPGP